MSITVWSCADCDLPLPKVKYRRPHKPTGSIYRPQFLSFSETTEPLCEKCWKKDKGND